MHIYPHSQARREISPGLFENRKRCPDFGKKDLDCVYLWVKFPIQNIVLRLSGRKNFKMFPCGVLFLSFLTKCLSKCSSTTIPTPAAPPLPPPLSRKSSGWTPALIHYSFHKTLHLVCLTVFWMRLCLGSCTVICTVTLCHVLRMRHSEFRIQVY